MLDLEAFRNTRTLGVDADCDPANPIPAYVYAGSCYIYLDELTGGNYLVIENMVWDNRPLAELEEILHREWYSKEYG